jgi:hypothetical protein
MDNLKEHLKSVGMTQSGDKGTLIHRCQLFEKCIDKNIVVENGKNPCLLKAADLKKIVAQNGLSPIGSNDELLTSLVNHLISSQLSTSTSAPAANSSAGHNSTTSSQSPSNVAIARRILELNEIDDFEGILNIAGGEPITKHSSVAAMRKAYLKLSLVIHPDKLERIFDQATKSFQALVHAFEVLSQPQVQDDIFMTNSNKSEKTKTISRSNEGCYRTRVCCPRCKTPWSEGTLDGNPEYFYNFLMCGLKQYTCSTCLFEFGCVTAIHKCPHCYHLFEYLPQVCIF